jgi:hypothetical protein
VPLNESLWTRLTLRRGRWTRGIAPVSGNGSERMLLLSVPAATPKPDPAD